MVDLIKIKPIPRLTEPLLKLVERKMGMPHFAPFCRSDPISIFYAKCPAYNQIKGMCKSKKIRSMVMEERFDRSRIRDNLKIRIFKISLVRMLKKSGGGQILESIDKIGFFE